MVQCTRKISSLKVKIMYFHFILCKEIIKRKGGSLVHFGDVHHVWDLYNHISE